MSVLNIGEKLKDCVLSCVVGDHLGSGTYRDVYSLRGDPTKVLKIEMRGYSFSNVTEWTIWNEVVNGRWAKWFAPIYHIDGFGAVIVQARTRPPEPAEWDQVKRLPSFLADLKRANFGIFEDRVVAHDYGNTMFFENGLASGRMISIAGKKHSPR